MAWSQSHASPDYTQQHVHSLEFRHERRRTGREHPLRDRGVLRHRESDHPDTALKFRDVASWTSRSIPVPKRTALPPLPTRPWYGIGGMCIVVRT